MTLKRYTPRRQSKRWLDGDCPDGVLAILDHPSTGDRYTIIYRAPVCGTTFADTVLGYRACSKAPFSPQGIGIYGEFKAYEAAAFRYRSNHHKCRWTDLPADVQKRVRQDLAPEIES